MADPQRGPYLAGGFPGQILKRDLSNRTMWVDDRESLQADRTYYVGTTPGNSDGNDGLSASAPFRTIQHAMDVAASKDLNGNHIIIQVGPGYYIEQLICRPITGGPGVNAYGGSPLDSITVRGNPANPSTGGVYIAAPGPLVEGAIVCGYPGWSFEGFTILFDNPAANGLAVIALDGCGLRLGPNAFISTPVVGNVLILGQANKAGKVSGYGTWELWGGWGVMLYCNATDIFGPTAITINGTPTAWYIACCIAYTDCFISLANTTITANVACTGKRYDLTLNTICKVPGGNINYFPGDVAGTVATGAQYVSGP